MRPVRSCVLQVRDLGFAYEGQPPIVYGWSADIGAGVTQIYGDTGAGKSTLLRLMAGALTASGRLVLDGTSLDVDLKAYRRKVFFVESTTDAFDQMTPRECVAALTAHDADFDEQHWRELAEGFGLAPHLHKPLYMLSTGSKRKVWLVAALTSTCKLTLLDEPTGGLDAASVACLTKALHGLAQSSHRAIVFASAERIERVLLAGTIELPLTAPTSPNPN
jgi:ABC-2 type transport system ATP-binding protein